MISCTEFIPAYSECFRFLEEVGGTEAVRDYWNYVSDKYCPHLQELVREHGIKGCWMFWSHSLSEEAADCRLELDEESGEFKIEMRECPSKGRLLAYKHIQPYRDYCGHCEALYSRALAPLGYEFSIDLSECDKARCVINVKRSE